LLATVDSLILMTDHSAATSRQRSKSLANGLRYQLSDDEAAVINPASSKTPSTSRRSTGERAPPKIGQSVNASRYQLSNCSNDDDNNDESPLDQPAPRNDDCSDESADETATTATPWEKVTGRRPKYNKKLQKFGKRGKDEEVRKRVSVRFDELSLKTAPPANGRK